MCYVTYVTLHLATIVEKIAFNEILAKHFQ